MVMDIRTIPVVDAKKMKFIFHFNMIFATNHFDGLSFISKELKKGIVR